MEEIKPIDSIFAIEINELQKKYSENIMLLGELHNTKHKVDKELDILYISMDKVTVDIDKVIKNMRNKYGDVVLDLNNMVYSKPDKKQ